MSGWPAPAVGDKLYSVKVPDSCELHEATVVGVGDSWIHLNAGPGPHEPCGLLVADGELYRTDGEAIAGGFTWRPDRDEVLRRAVADLGPLIDAAEQHLRLLEHRRRELRTRLGWPAEEPRRYRPRARGRS